MIDFRIFDKNLKRIRYSERLSIPTQVAFGARAIGDWGNQFYVYMLFTEAYDREQTKIYVGDNLTIKGSDLVYQVVFNKLELRYEGNCEGFILPPYGFKFAKVEGNIYE